jgi:hypothetical protein
MEFLTSSLTLSEMEEVRFKRLEISTLPCEYVLSLMIFIVKKQEFFHLILLYTLSTQEISISSIGQLSASLDSRRVHIMLA